MIAKVRAWQKAHPDRQKMLTRRFRQSEKYKEYMARYRAAYRERRRALDLARERRCPHCGAEMTHEQWLGHRFACSKRPASRHAIYRKDHPLAAGKHGRVATHRYVLYEKLGPGPHPCHWCGIEINWTTGGNGPGCPAGALVADHVNGDPHDNRPENLVAACNACNTLRGLIFAWERRTGHAVEQLRPASDLGG
jgi:ssDNA-binding Zn-finger/Zn-ribbon topoisomerase 1